MQVISAGVLHKNTADSDRQALIANAVEVSDGGELYEVEVMATDPHAAMHQVRYMSDAAIRQLPRVQKS